MRIKLYRGFSFICSVIFLAVLLSGCGQPLKPVSASSISGYGGGERISQASAVQAGLPITVWGLKGSMLTSGPYKGWKIETDENGTVSGLNEYTISPGSSSDVKDYYTNELKDDKWENGKDVSGDGYSGFSWTRGSQAFVAVLIENSNQCILLTYLLNK